MKFSYSWLKELSGTKKTAEEVAELFLTHSFEVEGIEDLAKGLEKVVIGEVLEVKKHPNADRLNVAKVNVGDENGGELQIVCGAPNLEVGQKVPVALVGAKLPKNKEQGTKNNEQKTGNREQGAEESDFFEIKRSKIRGVESFGMICAEDELGLGEKHSGILVLSDDAKVGQNLAEYLGLKDKVLDIDILPNRAHDCLGYEGVAQELAALENFKFRILNFDSNFNDRVLKDKDFNGKEISKTLDNSNIQSKFKIKNSKLKNKLRVKIDTPSCARYIGAKIKNIKIGPSPDWLQRRLKISDIKPINNIVDITNYVMLETGQPMHAFSAKGETRTDADLKRGLTQKTTQTDAEIDKIVVRQAKKGEKIKLLDEQELELTESDIVITDGQKPIALAGVMGGLESGVRDDTTEIILESANFRAGTIRQTKSRYNLLTDASYRFERDIDPNLAEKAMIMAIELIGELANGEVEAVTDVYPEPVEPWEIELDTNYVRRLLGVEIGDKEIRKILTRLGIDVKNSKSETLTEHSPVKNSKQIQNSDDKISKVVMVHGCPSNKEKSLKQETRTYDKHWQPWTKEQLKKNGIKVELPLMPHPWEPVYEEHKKEFEKINIDENSILIGHSCGANFLVRWLSETNKKIKKLILVAPWNEPNHKIKEKARFYDISDVDYSFKKNISDGVVIFTSNDEEQIGKDTAKMWTEKLNAKLIELKNHGHYTESGMGTTEFPELLEEILKINNSSLIIDNLLCTIPTRRRDLRTQEDLVEEVGRIYGYDKIKPQPLLEAVQVPHRNQQRFFERMVKDIVKNCGFDEVRGYSFYSKKSAEALGMEEGKHLSLMNPMNPDQALVRQTLASGILDACKKSLSYFEEVRLFDVGKVYIPKKEKQLPMEKLVLTMAVAGTGNRAEQFFTLKEALEKLFHEVNLRDWFYDDKISADENEIGGIIAGFHPSRRAVIKTKDNKFLGIIGEINKRVGRHFGVKKTRVAVAEIDINALLNELKREYQYDSLAKFPSVERDLSVIVGERTRVADVQNLIFTAGGKLIENVELFDLYTNPQTGERSMAFHLTFSHSERTLEAEEVDEQMKKIIRALEAEMDITLKR